MKIKKYNRSREKKKGNIEQQLNKTSCRNHWYWQLIFKSLQNETRELQCIIKKSKTLNLF